MKAGPLLSGAAALAAYLALAPPVSGAGDASELTLVLAFDGIAHPTGYPIWTLLGHLAARSLHALGVSWPYAANAWSALGGAVAVAFLHAAARRLLPPDREGPAWAWETVALLPAAILALHPAWTGVTTVAEVYSWHQAWVHGTVLAFLALLGIGSPQDGDGAPGRADEAGPRAPTVAAIAGWGLLVGVGLAHHLTSILVAIPLSAALVGFRIAGAGRPENPRRILAKTGAFALGAILPLASYALVYLKAQRGGPAQWPALAPGWASFWGHVTGAQYRGAVGVFAWPEADRALLEGWVYPVLVPALALVVAAAILVPRARPRVALGAVAAAVAAQIVFCFRYRVSDPAAYFLPALGLGLLSLPALIGSLAARAKRPRAVTVPAALVGAALAAWLGFAGAREGLAMRRDLVGLDRLLRRMWTAIPYERGIVLWRNDMVARLREFQAFEGVGKGLEPWNPWQFTDGTVRERFAARHGFDPVGDLSLAREDLLRTGPESAAARTFFAAVAKRINARVAMPVILFEPERPDVRVLEKGETARAPTSSPG